MRNSRERVRRNRRERIQRRSPMRRTMQKAYYTGGIQEEVYNEISDRVATIYLDTFMGSWRRAEQEAREELRDKDVWLEPEYYDEPLFDPDDYGWEEDDPDEYDNGVPIDFDWDSFVDSVIDNVEDIMPEILKERLFR